MEVHQFSEKPDEVITAGLVILHPFLLPLFENLNWCKSAVWIDESCRNKALLAIQYLATGKQTDDERALTLHKILCGFPADHKIDASVALTKKEMKECRKLLNVVIGYWKVLRNSSIKSLQENFLQRAGKLEVHNGPFELSIERKTVDILIENLPWQIGIIKTPWMQRPLLCHW